jgi:hypothetical protein
LTLPRARDKCTRRNATLAFIGPPPPRQLRVAPPPIFRRRVRLSPPSRRWGAANRCPRTHLADPRSSGTRERGRRCTSGAFGRPRKLERDPHLSDYASGLRLRSGDRRLTNRSAAGGVLIGLSSIVVSQSGSLMICWMRTRRWQATWQYLNDYLDLMIETDSLLASNESTGLSKPTLAF